MLRVQVDETYVDDTQDEFLYLEKLSSLVRELPEYGRIVIITYIEEVSPIKKKEESK
jgi:hypothetical protein